MSNIKCISPIDGRYANGAAHLREYFSEFALMRARVRVEVEWLKYIGEINVCKKTRMAILDGLVDKFEEADALEIKNIEKTTNHDVKAVEYWIRSRLQAALEESEFSHLSNFIHYGCTSEDINNLAYALNIKSALTQVLRPALIEIVSSLCAVTDKHAGTAMMSRTHGQPASPTTFGKEISVYVKRLSDQMHLYFDTIEYRGKFNGAVGNFNCHTAAHRDLDWISISKFFVEKCLNLTFQLYSTQIDCHDFIAEICDMLSRINTILTDLCTDMWIYISRDILTLKIQKDEVGSSTMPHKVNPIDFENAEGNFGIANCLLKFFSSKLPISRLQRDLTDSTVLRNLGVAFGHTLIAYKSLHKGLHKIDVNVTQLNGELSNNWAVLAEPIQTIMRKHEMENPYETMKELTRGHNVTEGDIRKFIEGIRKDISAEDFEHLMKLTPHTYTGIAEELAKTVTSHAKNALHF